MKTKEEVDWARGKVADALRTAGLTNEQKAVLCGMLDGLCWVIRKPTGSTLQRLLDGDLVAAGNCDPSAFDRLDKAVESLRCQVCGSNLSHSRLRGMFCPDCDGVR